MKQFTVYFEFFNKKMKTKIVAVDKLDAIDKVKDRINILCVNETTQQKKSKFEDMSVNEMFDSFKNIFGPDFKM